MGKLEVMLSKTFYDNDNLIYNISKSVHKTDKVIYIETELPARVDVEIILGYIQRWKEVQKFFNCKLRIFAWSYNDEVEKYINRCTQDMVNINITMLPFCITETTNA